MTFKKMLLTCTALLCLAGAVGCNGGPAIDTQPQDFKISGKTAQFAPPPAENWKDESVASDPKAKDTKGDKLLVRYVNNSSDAKFLSVTAVDLGTMTSWAEDPKATADLTRKFQDQILKRSDSKIIKQKQITLDGETALQLTYSYLEGTTKLWGSQIYVFHDKLLWNISISSPEEDHAEAEAVFKHTIDTFKFK